MLRAVIFDFDGVIADDELLHLEGFRHALAGHGIDVSEAEYFARYIGYDDRDGFTVILRDHGVRPDGDTVARLMSEKAHVFRELVTQRVRIFPGVSGLLESLVTADDPPATAIGSGALRSEVELVLEIAGLARYFDAIVCADDVHHGKPHPETYLRVLDQLARSRPRLMASECLVIEDSVAGLRAARAAGMATVAVTNSYRADDLDADLVIRSLEELNLERCREVVVAA